MDTPGDDDRDGLVNEALPSGSGSYDCDGDGFVGNTEQYIFSAGDTANDQKPCGVDAWPPDFNNDALVAITDLGAIAASFDEPVTPATIRKDIAPDPPEPPGQRFIDIVDIGRMAGLFGRSCS